MSAGTFLIRSPRNGILTRMPGVRRGLAGATRQAGTGAGRGAPRLANTAWSVEPNTALTRCPDGGSAPYAAASRHDGKSHPLKHRERDERDQEGGTSTDRSPRVQGVGPEKQDRSQEQTNHHP